MSLDDFKTRVAVVLCASTEVAKRGRPSASAGNNKHVEANDDVLKMTNHKRRDKKFSCR